MLNNNYSQQRYEHKYIMKHIIYKTTHKNGKYYIGSHSTENIDDGYMGSGRWVKQIKDKSALTREILEYAEDEKSKRDIEGKYLAEHYGKPGCMNMTPDPVGFNSDNNPMKNPEIADKIRGDKHYLNQHPEKREIFRKIQNDLVANGTHILAGENNPMKKPENKRKVGDRTRARNLTNNPSTWRAAEGIHHWQNGNAPNAGGKLNKKLIAEGRHNLVGPEHNRKMIEEGKNPWVGSAGNLKRLAEGTHPSQRKKMCEHCGKETSVGMYVRWHGDNCKHKDTK